MKLAILSIIYSGKQERMQAAEKSNYSELPLRNRNRSDGTFKKCDTERFVSNYFEAKIDNSVSTLYQYDYKLYDQKSNQIEPNSKLYRVFIKENKQKLIKVLGFEMAKGQMAFCRKDQPITNLKCQIKMNYKYNKDQKDEDPKPELIMLEAVFKKVKDINVKNIAYVGCPEEPMIRQLLNINIKNKLKSAEMQELGKTGKYFHKNPKILSVKSGNRNQEKDELKVIDGFKFNLLTYNNKYVLQVDTCFRVLQAMSFKEELKKEIKQKKSLDIINQQYRGQTVTAMYGNFRNYKIIKIHFDMNPKSKFQLSNGSYTTYEEYYRKNYNIEIEDLKQPLVEVPLTVDKKISKNGEIVNKQESIFLIPELICLSGLKASQERNKNVMKGLAEITKMKPQFRMEKCENFVKNLSKQNNLVTINPTPMKLDGYLLNLPTLIYGGGKQVKPSDKGLIRNLGKLKNPGTFKSYLFVYSEKGEKNYDKQDAYQVLECLKKSSKIYGVQFKDPFFLPIKNNKGVNQWMNVIQKDCKENGNPQIIVFLLDNRQESYYDQLKAFAINEIKCPSQVILKKTFRTDKQKAKMSAASKLAIQMNVKIGLPAWEVKRTHIYFRQKKLMYGALTTSKGKNGTYLSFVGTINDASSKFYGTCKKIESHLNIPTATLQQIYIQWARNYWTHEKKVPDDIIIYREGLNETQATRLVKDFEVPALEEMIKKIGSVLKISGYKPSWQIVTVNRKINARFFSQVKVNNSFVLDNPLSGSFITENFEEGKTFQMAPQFVSEGTLTPTRYTMLLDSSSISKQALISFTYEQSFNYFNWQGAVRVPGCLQYANKLAKMTSQHLKEDISKSPLNNMLFFL